MKTFFCSLSVLTLALSFLLVGSISFAKPRPYVGGQLTMLVPDSSGTNSRSGFNILGGAKLDGEWGVGGFLLTSGTADNLGVTIYGFEGNYNFQGMADDAYACVRFGVTKIRASSVDFSPTVMGLCGGYDILLNEHLGINMEAGWYSVNEATNGLSTLEKFNMLSFAGGVKFFF